MISSNDGMVDQKVDCAQGREPDADIPYQAQSVLEHIR